MAEGEQQQLADKGDSEELVAEGEQQQLADKGDSEELAAELATEPGIKTTPAFICDIRQMDEKSQEVLMTAIEKVRVIPKLCEFIFDQVYVV